MKLTKRGKIWWIDYRADGKRHRQSTGTADKAVAKELRGAGETNEVRVQLLDVSFRGREALVVGGSADGYVDLSVCHVL